MYTLQKINHKYVLHNKKIDYAVLTFFFFIFAFIIFLFASSAFILNSKSPAKIFQDYISSLLKLRPNNPILLLAQHNTAIVDFINSYSCSVYTRITEILIYSSVFCIVVFILLVLLRSYLKYINKKNNDNNESEERNAPKSQESFIKKASELSVFPIVLFSLTSSICIIFTILVYVKLPDNLVELIFEKIDSIKTNNNAMIEIIKQVIVKTLDQNDILRDIHNRTINTMITLSVVSISILVFVIALSYVLIQLSKDQQPCVQRVQSSSILILDEEMITTIDPTLQSCQLQNQSLISPS